MDNATKSGKKGMIIAGLIGLVVAIIFIALQINAGFSQAAAEQAQSLTLTFCGLDLFTITQNECGGYSGSDSGAGIPIICIVCIIAAIALEQIIVRLTRR